MCALEEPISRLAKRSMDSPYFTKQTGFDSPLTTSQEITPSVTPHNATQQRRGSVLLDSPQSYNSAERTPTGYNNSGNTLHTSQEINQLHASPFDSACVLHTAIQRAALLREQQKQQQQQQDPTQQATTQPTMILQGRRASVSGAGNQKYAGGRRSSLGTTSLHKTALKNSTGMKFSVVKPKQQKQPKQLSLRASQYIQQVDEIFAEGDE